MSERQECLTVPHVDISHTVRYLLARGRILPDMHVLDVFCGTGYGSRLMSDIAWVTAFDKFDAGIGGANGGRIHFIKAVYPDVVIDGQYDLITCFEAIEHLPREMSKRLLKDMHGWLKDDGQLFISSPNQLNYPFDKEKIEHHFFHYTPEEMEADLHEAGFKATQWWNQKAKFTIRIDGGTDGRYMIAVAKKI